MGQDLENHSLPESPRRPGLETITLARIYSGLGLANWRDADAMHICNAEQIYGDAFLMV
jgi:hypothetical protein